MARCPSTRASRSRRTSWPAGWLERRLAFLDRDAPTAGLEHDVDATWSALPNRVLPERAGSRPEVRTTTPQEQLTQNSSAELQELLFARLTDLPGGRARVSGISVPGARAFTLEVASGPPEEFLVPRIRECAHLHPAHDGSLHLALPPVLAADLVAKGWGVAHPFGRPARHHGGGGGGRHEPRAGPR